MFLRENTYSQNWIWTGIKSQLTVQQRDTSKILIDWGRVWARDVKPGTRDLMSWVLFIVHLFMGFFLSYCGTSSKISSLTWISWVTIPWSLTEGTLLDSAFLGHVVRLSTIETELFFIVSILFFLWYFLPNRGCRGIDVVALTWVWSSSVARAQVHGPELLVNAGFVYMHQRQSNSQAFSARSSSMVGCGDTPIIF